MRQLVIKFPERDHAEEFIEWMKLQGKELFHTYLHRINNENLDVNFVKFDFVNLVIETKEK